MARDEVLDPHIDAEGGTDGDADLGSHVDERVEDTVEALRAAARAAVEVGRQVLDAVERALDDPATADKLTEVVAGFRRLSEGMRPRSADEGPGGSAGGRTPDGALEHIEVS